MRFYKGQHKYYCGIDLHARKMYVCIRLMPTAENESQSYQTRCQVFRL
jgi:hypothetical protein